jgi:hypothetical protein
VVAYSRPSARSLAAVGLGIVLVVAAALAIPIAGPFPGLAGLFSEDGIALRAVKSSALQVEGSDAIVVEGELVNAGDHELPVPAVRISLQSELAGEVYSWLVEPTTTRLAAGGMIGFRSALANPVPGATRVALALAERAQQIGLR